MHYFDHAAATPLDERVLEAMRPYYGERFFNPSAIYAPARETRNHLDRWRGSIARVLSVRPGEIYFTAGATESINLAFGGILRKYPDTHAAASAIEHSSVLASGRGFADRLVILPVMPDGRVDPEEIAKTVDDQTSLVSIGYVNGEIGTIQPLKEIAEVLERIRDSRLRRGIGTPLIFHTDASQAPECLPVQPRSLGVDLLTLNGGKIYGPKQSGILYVRHGVELEPLIYGGGQERGLRGGTESVAALAGFAKALELAQASHKQESRRLQAFQSRLLNALEKYPNTRLNGPLKHRVAGNVHVSFRGINGEELIHYLDARGILAATGSACNATGSDPSPVLTALGCDEASVTGSLRLSMGRLTTEDDIDALLEALTELLPKLHKRSAESA